jgi:hypothetical protein
MDLPTREEVSGIAVHSRCESALGQSRQKECSAFSFGIVSGNSQKRRREIDSLRPLGAGGKA